ncbi:MAG: hypothetical protein ACOCXQ_00680 [Patescibacteria group bacterium]
MIKSIFNVNPEGHYLVFVDTPDPDNLALAYGTYRMFPKSAETIVLTGRPTRYYAAPNDPIWDWSREESVPFFSLRFVLKMHTFNMYNKLYAVL